MSDLVITAGKYYRTRDGRKAFVAALRLPSPFPSVRGNILPFFGYVEGHTCGIGWDDFGRSQGNSQVSPLDLLTEWREPRTWKRDVLVVDHSEWTSFYVVEVGQESMCGKLVARKTITLTEGEGV